MKVLTALVLITSLFRIDIVWAGVPIDMLWGNSEYHEHDTKKHVFRNYNWQLEGWLRNDHALMKKFESEEIPEQKKIVIILKNLKDCKQENWHEIMAVGIVCSQKRIKPFFVHCAQDPEYSERLDIIMMPNGSIAVLNSITNQLRNKYDFLEASIAIDGSYPDAKVKGHEDKFIRAYLSEKISESLTRNEEPVLFCTLFSYNAEKTLTLLQSIKDKFGSNVRTGIGGQLVRVSPKTYQALSFIDHVGVGDAEVILESLLVGKKPYKEGYLQLWGDRHYAPFSYENYLALNDRLDEMNEYKFGPFSGFRQVVVESVRGCAWAYKTGRPCKMCSLESVDNIPIFKPLQEYFATENHLAERFGVNWVFDVSNQFIPIMGEENQGKWLSELLVAKKKYSRHDINKYVYLTSNSISERTAPLLRKVGVRICYIGFDGWDTTTRKALNKPQSDPQKVLRLCRENDIYVRLGIVIGSGLNKQNVQELPKFAESIIGEFKGTILTWGNFLEIIMPGSRDWYELEEKARQNGWQEVTDLYRFFYQKGYLTWPQQEKMTELYIRLVQKADYDEVVAMWKKTIEIVRPHAIPITFQDGGHLEKA